MKKFELSEKEDKDANEFMIQHRSECEIHYTGAIGGRYTYSFTPTGLGVCCEVKCVCGTKKNVTDYTDW